MPAQAVIPLLTCWFLGMRSPKCPTSSCNWQECAPIWGPEPLITQSPELRGQKAQTCSESLVVMEGHSCNHTLDFQIHVVFLLSAQHFVEVSGFMHMLHLE